MSTTPSCTTLDRLDALATDLPHLDAAVLTDRLRAGDSDDSSTLVGGT